MTMMKRLARTTMAPTTYSELESSRRDRNSLRRMAGIRGRLNETNVPPPYRDPCRHRINRLAAIVYMVAKSFPENQHLHSTRIDPCPA